MLVRILNASKEHPEHHGRKIESNFREPIYLRRLAAATRGASPRARLGRQRDSTQPLGGGRTCTPGRKFLNWCRPLWTLACIQRL